MGKIHKFLSFRQQCLFHIRLYGDKKIKTTGSISESVSKATLFRKELLKSPIW